MHQLKLNLASNRLTIILIVLLFVAVIVNQQFSGNTRLIILLIPSLLLLLNFGAVLIRRHAFATKPALLVFHLALMALVVLAFWGQLTYLKGTLELGTLESFNGQLENVQKGPWHNYTLGDEIFTNLGFSINYHKGMKRDATLNQIQLNDGQMVEIGDHVPLVFGHYRLYTTHNKGYAPLFLWTPNDGGEPQLGSVHLPAYPTHEYEQAREWMLPNTQQKIWTMLVIDEEVMPTDRDFDFKIPLKNHVVVRLGNRRYTLEAGDELRLESGVLRYTSLSSWMGYKVDYDWTRSWILITCFIALIALTVNYLPFLSRKQANKKPRPDSQ